MRDAMNTIGIRLDYLAHPGNLPEDFLVDQPRHERELDVGSLRVQLHESRRQIAELERVLRNAVQMWHEIEDIVPEDFEPPT